MALGKTAGAVIDEFLDFMVNVVYARMQLLFNFDYHTKDPSELVKLGLIDPVRVFIKNEPHKVSKILEKRLRLIASVSLADNTICRVLCTMQNKSEIDQFTNLLVKPGMGLTDAHIKQLWDGVPEEPLKQTDFKSWDWQVTEQMLFLDLERRRMCNGASYDSVWYKCLKAHYWCICNNLFVTSDGRMYALNISGVLLSGWYNTSGTNSNIRIMLAFAARDKESRFWAMSMGDDCLEKDSEGLEKYYESTGMRLGMFSTSSKLSGFEFCSHFFKDGNAYPLNVDKMLYRFLCSTESSEDKMMLYCQLLYELRNHPDSLEIRKLLWSSGGLNGVPVLQSPNLERELIKRQETVRADSVPSWDLELHSNIQSASSLAYPIQMTRRTKNKKNKQVTIQVKQKQQPKSNNKSKIPPNRVVNYTAGGGAVGATLGAILGSVVPGIGTGIGASLGGTLGSGIGRIMGSGDYVTSPAMPGNNTFVTQTPKFANSQHGVVITHREYLQDITGSAAFTTNAFPLNPSNSTTFPWLSTIAENFEQFRIRGMVFEFRTMSSEFNNTTSALGSVILATEYNSAAAAFQTKQAMENYEFAVSTKPSCNMLHAIECKTSETTIPHLYVGAAPTGYDSRFYNLGTTYLATVGMPTAYLIGELWISYSIEFYKPKVPSTIGGNLTTSIVQRSGGTGTTPLGLTPVRASGSFLPSVTPTTIVFQAGPQTDWYLTVAITGAAATIAAPVITITGATTQSVFVNKTSPTYTLPANGTSSTSWQYSVFFTSNSTTSQNLITLSFGTAGTVPTASNVDIFLTQLDESVIPLP